MPPTTPTTTRRRTVRLTAVAGAVALAVAPLVAGAEAASAATPVLKAATIPGFANALENASSHSLYLLSTEKGAKLHCKSTACLKTWGPLEVKSSVKKIAVGTGVKGKISFVTRSKTEKQVTFNGYPVYTYVGDTGPNESHGEALQADGGTWRLVHAGATTATATPFASTVQSASIPSYRSVLENGGSSRSLYVLSAEKGAVLKCTGTCTSTWPPLLVPTATTSVSLGAGVKGTIGFVTRSATQKQVTFNSYPVYTYANDPGPNQSQGEGIVADGGTWTLVHAGATTAAGTPVAAPSSGGGW